MKSTYLKPVLDMEATGKNIKALMKRRGVSVRELQAVMGFPYVQTIYNWFAGKNMPSIDNLLVLSQVLGKRMDEILVTRTVETQMNLFSETAELTA